jgi:hypothetical protein
MSHNDPEHPQPQPSIIQPIIDDLKRGHTTAPQPVTQPPAEDEKAPPPGPVHPPQPAELDQDAGGGYNANRTNPQT